MIVKIQTPPQSGGGVCMFVNSDKVSVATVTIPIAYSHVEIITYRYLKLSYEDQIIYVS
jgi:hypothetical protein